MGKFQFKSNQAQNSNQMSVKNKIVLLDDTVKHPDYTHADSKFSAEPLYHKDGRIFDDVDYCILMAEECDELDNQNTDKSFATVYPYDKQVVETCRYIRDLAKEGKSHAQLNAHIKDILNMN